MRILLSSFRFAPDVGGIETVSSILAEQFARLGHEVIVITKSRGLQSAEWPFTVIRHPSAGRLVKLLGWCDAYLQNNISLRSLWPLLIVRRRTVVAHHTWISRPGGTMGWQDIFKRAALPLVRNIAISDSIKDHLRTNAVMIPDPYDDGVFRPDGTVPSRDLVFVGRLVSDKGADVLLAALINLREKGLTPSLTIVGSGPDASALESKVHSSGLASQVTFAGIRQGPALASTLRQHRIMVVPSRWAEPFGIVALEGIACGCVVVGSELGGLPEAIGPCGMTFPNGDAASLAVLLERLLRNPGEIARLRAGADRHLVRHQPERVAQEYLTLLSGGAGAK